MRKQIVAGNWKMNNNLAETELFFTEMKKQVIPENVKVIVAPAFTNLQHAFSSTKNHPVTIAAQNMHQSESGAFTGEVSAQMLKSVGIETVILGHSERRAYFHEDNQIVSEKVNTALENDMTVLFCFGEELQDRNAGTHFDLVRSQLEGGLFHISEENWKNIILAYEPVWAIGTGETASPEQVQEMHKFIRKTVAENTSNELSNNVSILYGGSVKPSNAAEIFGQADVDGGLIGGASLKVTDFMDIINAFA